MKLEEFENQYRNAMDDTLNQLQTVILLLAQVESQVRGISSSVQNLSLTVEKYINENKSE
jgi:ABC-type transporter Mla subunit MlaD